MTAVFSSTNRRMGSRSSVNSLKTSHEIKISVIVVTNLRYIHRSQIRTPYDRLMANEQPSLARSTFFLGIPFILEIPVLLEIPIFGKAVTS